MNYYCDCLPAFLPDSSLFLSVMYLLVGQLHQSYSIFYRFAAMIILCMHFKCTSFLEIEFCYFWIGLIMCVHGNKHNDQHYHNTISFRFNFADNVFIFCFILALLKKTKTHEIRWWLNFMCAHIHPKSWVKSDYFVLFFPLCILAGMNAKNGCGLYFFCFIFFAFVK